ncbi:DUF3990 domain-containing protein [Clostridium tagluense]|uniref:DUF3990 domain-containing protein n=1 Tax=Clostridium tagluense TaxID=360422 RepID=UPI000F61A0FE|nr:DUF3990 domain-containing protein [Clostridium tagluense]
MCKGPVAFQKMEMSKCRPYKDFGKGFYCTTIKSQAEMSLRIYFQMKLCMVK